MKIKNERNFIFNDILILLFLILDEYKIICFLMGIGDWAQSSIHIKFDINL